MKEELFWLNEYGGLNDLKQQMDDWVTYYTAPHMERV
jgi:hypothetical protein